MKTLKKIVTVLLFVLFFSKTYALDAPTFGDDVQDNNVAPINDYLPHALFIAVALGWYFYRKVALKKA